MNVWKIKLLVIEVEYKLGSC